jgi:hypothetical protein
MVLMTNIKPTSIRLWPIDFFVRVPTHPALRPGLCGVVFASANVRPVAARLPAGTFCLLLTHEDGQIDVTLDVEIISRYGVGRSAMQVM